MNQTIVDVPLISCERDADFIYVKLDPPHRTSRHRHLKIRIEITGSIPDAMDDPKKYVDLIQRTRLVVEEHDSMGAPATTREELTIAVAELKHYYEIQRKKKGASKS